MSRTTTARAKNREGELTVSHLESDSPLLPVVQLERLHTFRPDLVDWVKDQTQKEAEHRRRENAAINKFVFVERIFGQFAAFLLGLSGIIGGGYIILSGHPVAGASVAGATISGLAIAFLTGRTQKNK